MKNMIKNENEEGWINKQDKMISKLIKGSLLNGNFAFFRRISVRPCLMGKMKACSSHRKLGQ